MNCARHEGDKSVGGFFKMDAKTNMTSNKKDVWKIEHNSYSSILVNVFCVHGRKNGCTYYVHVDDFNN
jgi:hypothetical protein